MLTVIASIVILALSILSSASPVDHLTRQASSSLNPIPPSHDPFYTPPTAWQTKAPGEILRIRTTPGNLTTTIGNASASYNILYRTTDALQHASWAMTTLFVPSHDGNKSCSALLSYQIPYNTADVDSSPSYSLYTEGSTLTDIPAALGRGWCVNIPDFEGPLASFGLGVQEGHATLDSVRAALSSNVSAGPSPSTRYAMWGYSGGSIASEWAAELQSEYAPELNFSGMAIGGLPGNVTETLKLASRGPFAGLIPVALVGATTQFPAARDYLLSQLKPSGLHNETTFLAVRNMSIAMDFAVFINQTMWNYFRDGVAVLDAPVMQDIFFTQGLMGYHGIPSMPMFVYKAIADELCPIQYIDALVQRYCDVGVDILYERNEIGGHYAEYINGDASAFQWLVGVLEGTSARQSGCTVRNVWLNVTDSPF